MKLTNKILEKFGTDKVLHFMGGALITAVFAIFGFNAAIVGAIATVFLAFFKEAMMDAKFDVLDLLAGIIGAAFIVGVSALTLLL